MMDALKANLNSICRLCLTKVDDPSTMQTLEDEETDTMWTSSVRSFTLKKPVSSEILPNKMCSYCAEWITKLIHFKLQCTVSDSLLTSFFKHYKEEVQKTTAVVRVGEQQWDIPGPNTRELLSRCDDHLSRLHKAVQFTVMHLDKCASNGQPVLPYRKTKTNQFFVMFIDQLSLYVNSVIPTDGEGILRTHMPDMRKEQPWESGNIPVWAQKNSKQTIGKFWDRLIQATCCPKFTQNTNSGAPSGEQSSSQHPLLQAVPSHSSVRSGACSEKSQTPPVIQLDDDDVLPQSSYLSKSLQLKQAELSAPLTSQPHRLVTSKPKGLSKQVGENIPNVPKTAETRKKLNDVSEVWSLNIEAQQHGQSTPPKESVQVTSAAQNANVSQAVGFVFKGVQLLGHQRSQAVQSKPSKCHSVQGKTPKFHIVQLPSSAHNTNISQAVQGKTPKFHLLQLTSPPKNTNVSQVVQGKTSKFQLMQLTCPVENTNISQAVQGKTFESQPVQLTGPPKNTNVSQAMQSITSESHPVQLTGPARNTNASQAVQGKASKFHLLQLASPAQKASVPEAMQSKTSKPQAVQLTNPVQSANVSRAVRGKTSKCYSIQSTSSARTINVPQAVRDETFKCQSVKLTSPAVSTNISQAVQVKTSKSQSDTQLSNSAGVSVPLESLLPKNQETVLTTEVFSEVSELLIPTLVQENLEDEILQSSVNGLVECAQKSVKQLTGLKGQVVEHSGSLGLSNSAESAKKTRKSVQVSQRAQELNRGLENTLEQFKNEAKNRAENKKIIKKRSPKVSNKNSEKQKCQEVLKKTSESQETVKQTLGTQEVNRVQEQTNKTGSKEVISQTTSLQKQSKICQAQMNKTSELQTSEKHQTGSEQPREAQISAIQATETKKSTSSSSGQESSTKSTEKPRLQPKDKQKLYYLILQQKSQANKIEKTVPLIIKCGKRVCSYKESVSTGPKKHIELRIESEPVDKVSKPSSIPNAGVYALTPLIPIPKSTTPSVPSTVSSMSELEERRIIKEIPSGVSTSIDSENTVPSTSRSSQQPNINTSETSTAQKNSNLSEKNTENSAVNSNSPSMLQPIKRNENRKSGEEAPTAEEPVVESTEIIRVRQDLTTDPPTRNSSHSSKDVPLSTSNVSQQNMQYNGTERVSEPSGQQSQAPIPMFSMASMNRMAVSQQQQANSRVVVMPVSSPLSHPVQRFRHNPQTLGTPVPVSYPQQPSVITSVVKKTVQQVPQHKNNPIFGTVSRHQMAQAGTSTSTSQRPWITISVPKYQKAQTGAAIDSTHFTEGPRMTALMVQTEKIPTRNSRLTLQTNVPGQVQANIATSVQISEAGQQQQQTKPATSISQANVLGQQQQAKPTASVSQKVMQSTNIVLQHQTKEVQSSRSPLVAEKASNNEILSASGTCFPNPTIASKAINVSVPKLYKSTTGVPVPSASDNQSNKQQFLNVNTQYNRTLLESKQQNALSTAGSNGDLVVDMQRTCEDGGRVVLESEAGARNTDQPGTSVLPEVVHAIGPELGIFIREDGLNSSVCRTTPCKFPIVVPEHCVMPKQSNKSSMQRSPKDAAALTQPVKLNILSPIKTNSKELLSVSEERKQKLPATVSTPTSIRRSNLPIKSPGGVKSRKYFNREKKELKKPASPVDKEPEPPPNITVHRLMDNMLQSEVAASSENHGEDKKPCAFQIKVTRSSVKYKSSRMGHNVIKQTESSDSCEPPAKRARVICDDDDIREVETPSIKVWQLKSYQLAPYVSLTKLHPEFFKAGSAYNLKDLKVAAKARTLSMVVRKPGTVGKSVKSLLP